MKQLLPLLTIMVITTACSQHRKKSNTAKSNDRSASISFSDSLAFVNAQNDTVANISIAVADNQKKRSEGLMDVNHLPQNNGMLFIFDKSQELSFWMANTPLPLDIIFVNKAKKIVRIHHSTKPYTEKNFASGKPALYAVETNGGFCIAHDIQEGMRIKFQATDHK